MRKVLPFLKIEYFRDNSEKIVYETVKNYIVNFNSLPSMEAVQIDIEENKNLQENEFANVIELLQEIRLDDEESNEKWLLESAEKFCQERAVHNAILDSIHILDGKSKDKTKGAIPELLSKALSVSFDVNVGHDYISDSEKRYEFYNNVENKIPFDIEMLNKITQGGLPNKTLNVLMAGCVHPETKVKIRFKKKI